MPEASLENLLLARSGREERIVAMAEYLSSHFRVAQDEVALLLPEERMGLPVLRFHWPLFLRDSPSGYVLLSSKQAIAAATARNHTTFVDNCFTCVPHTSIFEVIPPKKEEPKKPDPIQKIISVPLSVDAAVTGVLQLSRKGPTPQGLPDFTPADLTELQACARVIGRYI